MEEMLLRVCIVVASLLFIKEHTIIQEQEESVSKNMQEREYLLQKEAAKLEQEAHRVTTGLPHSNQEVSQSHRKLTNREGQDSDVHPVENSNEHQVQDILDQNLSKEAVSSNHDGVPPALQHSVIVDKNFPSDNGEQPEFRRSSHHEFKNVQEDYMSGHKTEIPHHEQNMEALKEDQMNEDILNGAIDTDQKYSHLNQVEGTFNQMLSENDPSMEEITEENATASSEQSTENTRYFWKFLSLISLIRLLRKFVGRGSENPITSIKGKTTSTGILTKICIPDHQVLSSFYERCVRIPPSTCSQICEFVEGFVDDLLEAVREASNEETDMQIGDFIGVGSLYELWATGKPLVCDLYVPVTAPKTYGFDVELWKEKDASLLGFGKIKMVKDETTSNGCPCMDGNLDEDMLCLLHPHNAPSKDINAIGGPLCHEGTPYLSKKQVVRWFRRMIIKAWGEISYKYEFELGFRRKTAPGALKVRFRSGQIILFNITPVVQVKASDAFLVSHISNNQNSSNTHWPISFASYENTILRYFNKTLPCNSCHIKCLQILDFLHKQQIKLTGKCGLTSHHLKSTLLHLLIHKPTEWKHEQLSDRLVDMLTFLEQKLQAKEFNHAFIGNAALPMDIGLPNELKAAKPNIFLPMVLEEEYYLKTVQHLQELMKNAPVLIQEYGSETTGLQKGNLNSTNLTNC